VCALATDASAKRPGGTYCFNGVCHRVKTVAETSADVGRVETVRASFYDDCKVDPGNPCTKLSSGEEFRADRADNAASPVYPNGTVLVLTNPENHAAARVRINNSGPYVKGRLLDVSRATALALGFIDAGVTELQIKVVAAPPSDDDGAPAYTGELGAIQKASAQN
jgi:rare lipoprotein A